MNRSRWWPPVPKPLRPVTFVICRVLALPWLLLRNVKKLWRLTEDPLPETPVSPRAKAEAPNGGRLNRWLS